MIYELIYLTTYYDVFEQRDYARRRLNGPNKMVNLSDNDFEFI